MKKSNVFTKAFSLVLLLLLSSTFASTAQTYRYIKGWSKETNDRLESFLNSTVSMKERKVAAFDCDGTLFGQVPYYLADEALYDYAKKNYEGKTDARSVEKMKVVDKLLHGDNVGVEYVQSRSSFVDGILQRCA